MEGAARVQAERGGWFITGTRIDVQVGSRAMDLSIGPEGGARGGRAPRQDR